MKQVNWNDYRIACQVAESGSLSGAGVVLGMNHATVLRHLNQLELALGVRLFIRHQRGYRLTDAGQIMLEQLPAIERQFTQLENRLSSVEGQISGELRITTVVSMLAEHLYPGLKAYREAHPQIRLKLIATDETLPLDTGAAHVSLRIGSKPNGPDLIVKKLSDIPTHYYADQAYVQQYGIPSACEAFCEHQWVLPSGEKRNIGFVKAVLSHIDEDNIVYQSNNFPDVYMAVIAGLGIGPLEEPQAKNYPRLTRLNISGLQQTQSVWFVYHRDLKDSIRIKALFEYLSAAVE